MIYVLALCWSLTGSCDFHAGPHAQWGREQGTYRNVDDCKLDAKWLDEQMIVSMGRNDPNRPVARCFGRETWRPVN